MAGIQMKQINNKIGTIKTILWWCSALLLFIGVFATAPRLYYITAVLFNQLKDFGIQFALDSAEEKARFLREVVAPIKGISFLLAMAGLLPPLVRNILDSHTKDESVNYKRALWTSALFLLVVGTFITSKGLSGGNLEYADQSGVVFEKGNKVWLYQRFLMPAIAYILFFRGQFFYLAFSILCIYAMVYVAQIWFEKNQIHLKYWQLISIFSAGFVFVKLQYPGSPDVFVHLFLLILFAFPLGELAQLSLVALSLASHEASIFLFAAIAIFFKEGKLRIKYLAIIFVYMLIWLVSIRFDITSLLYTPQIRGFSPIGTIIANPSNALWGIFFTNKLIWLLIVAGLVIVARRRDHRTFFQILALTACGILMSLIGVDTIRMFSWSFFSIFIAVKVIHEEHNPKLSNFMNVVLILNLLVAPLYADLHGVRVPSGIYQIIYSFIGLR
jgi:hypothetical protein